MEYHYGCYPCVNTEHELESTAEDGPKEVSIVLLADAVVEPHAMMVKFLNASVAFRAVP